MKKLSQYALFVACCGLIGMAVGTAIKATCGTSIWHLAMVATGVAEPDYEAIVDRIFYGDIIIRRNEIWDGLNQSIQ